jgi:hypothetical protein
MPKFKVTSGEFEVIVHEKTHRKAGDLAIQLHDQSNHPSKLGELTLIEKLDRQSQPTGDHAFVTTQHLIQDNTDGLGSDMGQYRRLTEEEEQND